MLTVQEETLRISGSGETEILAFQDILSQVKSKLGAQYPGVLLQIEPQGMEVLTANIHTYTERFLGFLFSRKCKSYHLTVNLTVKLRHLDTTKISYTETMENLSAAQHILKMR